MAKKDLHSEIEQKNTIADLTGISYINSLKYISKSKLKLGKILFSESEYRTNTVVNQSIKPGSELNENDVIDLTISNVNPIKYLPSMYQSGDSKNGGFLKRYLWLFQHIIHSITAKLDNIEKYFNPMEAPLNFFNWIASWVSINVNYAIPEDKMRLLVKEAINLYQWRGTAIGIAKFLEIITGVKPEIIENYSPVNEYVVMEDKLIERPIIEEYTTSYYFTVAFPVSVDHFDIETIKKISQIIKTEKPVHANYYITFKTKKEAKKKTGLTIGESPIGQI
jgi:phage tail-like protein